MSMTLRAAIIIAEMIGFCFTFFLVERRYYKKKKMEANGLKKDLIIFIISFSLLFILFFTVFPTYIFLSYKKMLMLTILIFEGSIFIIYFRSNKFLENFQDDSVMEVVFWVLLVTVVAIVIFSYQKSNVFEDKTESVYYTYEDVNPIILTEKNEDDGKRSYLYIKKDTNSYHLSEFSTTEDNVKEINSNETTRIHITTTHHVIINKERKKNNSFYKTEKEEKEYKVFINRNDKNSFFEITE